jgi:indolepyruvate decarboxylase
MGMHTARLDRTRTILANTEKLQVGLHGYEHVLLPDFLSALKKSKIARKKFINRWEPSLPAPLSARDRKMALSAESFFRVLGLSLSNDATLVCDVGDAMIGAIGLRTTEQNDFLADAYYLSMGFAVPAAIGAMAAKPKNRVYTVVGDGAFQMTGIELSTCAKYNLHPIVLVLNNDGYGTQRKIIDGPFNEIHQWNYTKVCDLLGYGRSMRVRTNGELESALAEAAKLNEMTLIEVMLPRDDSSRPLRRMAAALAKMRDTRKGRSAGRGAQPN